MKPPLEITGPILNLCGEIERLLGRCDGLLTSAPQPRLRKQNRIRTIKDTLAIEGNTMSAEQVTAILDGKRVLGSKNEILEVKNTVELYSFLSSFQPTREKDFLKAHAILMKQLLPDAGKLRAGNVGVLNGSRVSHLAPPAKLVPKLIHDLFEYLKSEKTLHPLIKSAIAHYEIEFIHPFSDGNGRMGRFWQTLTLAKYHPLFEYLPTESIVREKQAEYYRALEQSDRSGFLNPFVLFSLNTILRALKDLLPDLRLEPVDGERRLEIANEEIGGKSFTRADYLKIFKSISTATASRDLAFGVKNKKLKKLGDQRLTTYKFQ